MDDSRDTVEAWRKRLGPVDPQQAAAWRRLGTIGRANLAFQLYQMALDIVRHTERQRHPDLSPEELNWRVTRRMQGDPNLGKAEDILIAKLIAYKETGSDKHLRDVRGILITQSDTLDMERVLQRARSNDVIDPLEKVLGTL